MNILGTSASSWRHGLVAAAVTDGFERAVELANRPRAGSARGDAATSAVDRHVSFGGPKRSGIGPKEYGLAARGFYTEARIIPIPP